MSQAGVQLVIGKLLTDADFRRRFEAHGAVCLARLRELGIDVNAIETAALVETDRRAWSRMATLIDRRLLSRGRGPSEPAHLRLHQHLTERQQRVLAGVCEGFSNREIASAEGVSETAIKASVQQLFRKARVRRRAQLVRLAVEGALRVARPAR